MQVRSIKPNPKYLTRMRLVASIVALAILTGAILFILFLLPVGKMRLGAALMILFFTLFFDLIWWVLAMFLLGPYYRSLRYEVQDDEVIVYAGIWTQSVKHVPYRTVTNLTVKRDVLDRWLGLGTLNIQTAGMSGQKGAEEHLAGLTDVQGVYDAVAGELRRFRGGMAPTQADVDVAPVAGPPDVLGDILAEVQAIRKAMETPQQG
jgi:membrane protein YdbS with pleckstrin-like domain